jgi:hypothetical protein
MFTLCVTAGAKSQNTAAYAITGAEQGSLNWTEIKKIDLHSGQVISNVFENTTSSYKVFSIRTGREIKIHNDLGKVLDESKLPFAGLSAACAFDARNQRLFYVPMFKNELRYIDLSKTQPDFHFFENEQMFHAGDMADEANHITRMCIDAEGNGYALDNASAHLVRFSTEKTPVVTDLGALVDDALNGDKLISDKSMSWGGDMVASATGELYLITAQNRVFAIDIRNRVARFVADIEGLASGFTTNGAVVDASGSLLLSSANYINGYYKVNPATWQAEPMPVTSQVFNTSDLANENVLFEAGTALSPVREAVHSSIKLYPNPVRARKFMINFNGQHPPGYYDVQLMDLGGRVIEQRKINVAGAGQVAQINIQNFVSKGVYYVKVLNNNKNEVLLNKIVVD